MNILQLTRILLAFALFTLFASTLSANTLIVPTDYSSIQSAIDAASDGDTILVNAGTYYENISITMQKTVHLIGAGQDETIIDGGGNGNVVVFNIGHGSISNFTIKNSGTENNNSRGIFVSQSNVLIEDNIITENKSGIVASSGSDVVIQRNKVINNDNSFLSGAIEIATQSTGVISNNLIANNTSNGIEGSPKIIANNTIHGNGKYGLFIKDLTDTIIITNNIVTENEYGIMLFASGFPSFSPITKMSYNNIWNNSVADYWEEYNVFTYNSGSSPLIPLPGTGEKQEDPQYVDSSMGDFRLQATSPCVNAGRMDTVGLYLSTTDLNNQLRITDDIIDMGAYEFLIVSSSFNIPSEQDINIYPNPANEILNVEFMNHEIKEIKIMDVSGKLIIELFPNKEKELINISSLEVGIYCVHIQTEKELIITKFIKR